jgi:DNA transposition AAA+ family ATPase
MTVVDYPVLNKSGPPSANGDPQLPEERVDTTRRRLRKHLDCNEEVSLAKVAKRIGFSSATLSLFLSSTYNGSVSNVARAVETYLNLYEQQKSVGGQPKYVRTSVARKIERAIQMAEAVRGISIIATQSGVGATWALRDHEDKYPLSLRISCSPDMGTRWALLAEILAVLGKPNQRPAFARRAIVEALAGTDRTILVDESHYLTQECADILRCIHDQAEVPVVFVGNETTYEGFRVRASAGHRGIDAMAYTQLRGRLAARLTLKVRDITANDIKLIALQMAPADAVEESLLHLRSECVTSGGFRRVVRILQVAQMLAAGARVRKGHILRSIEEIRELSAEVDQ